MTENRCVFVVTTGKGTDRRFGKVVRILADPKNAEDVALGVAIRGCCSGARWEEDESSCVLPVRDWKHCDHWVRIVPWAVT